MKVKFTGILNKVKWDILLANYGEKTYSEVVSNELYRLACIEFNLKISKTAFNKLLVIDKNLREWIKMAQAEVSLVSNLPKIYLGDWLSAEQVEILQKEHTELSQKLLDIFKERDALFLKTRKENDKLVEREERIYKNASGLFLISKVTIDAVPIERKEELLSMPQDNDEEKEKYRLKAKEIANDYQKFLVTKLDKGKLPDDVNPFL